MSKVGKWESGKVPVLLSHRNENKSPFILHFVRFSLSLTLSKILSLDNKNKKISFCFVLCSFIRIFASYKAITEDMNITRKTHKSLICRELLPTLFAHVVFPENIFPQVKSSMGDTTFIEQMVEWFPMLFPSETWRYTPKCM